MAALMDLPRIGIDLTEPPLRVGGRKQDQYIVKEGSKGLKLAGRDAGTTKEEMTAILKDVVVVVKSIFGNENFGTSVIVIPNDTNQLRQEDIVFNGRAVGLNIEQAIKEHTAVCAAYVEKAQPNVSTNLAILSMTSGIFEISVVSIEPLENKYIGYRYTLLVHETLPENHQAHDQKDEGSGSGIIGLIGGAAKTLLVEASENVVGFLKDLLQTPKFMMIKVDKVVFVGKASRWAKVRKAVTESFSSAEVWEGIDNPDEIVAYGAAYLCHEYKEIRMDGEADDPNVDI